MTCLKLELVRRGEAAAEGSGEGLRGEDETESRLLICSGDQPLADEWMIELRAAADAALGDAVKRSRLEGEVGAAEGDGAVVDMMKG